MIIDIFYNFKSCRFLTKDKRILLNKRLDVWATNSILLSITHDYIVGIPENNFQYIQPLIPKPNKHIIILRWFAV